MALFYLVALSHCRSFPIYNFFLFGVATVVLFHVIKEVTFDMERERPWPHRIKNRYISVTSDCALPRISQFIVKLSKRASKPLWNRYRKCAVTHTLRFRSLSPVKISCWASNCKSKISNKNLGYLNFAWFYIIRSFQRTTSCLTLIQ